ncbi:MAG: GEVED domain-containing protein [Bacteroidia bacterium]
MKKLFTIFFVLLLFRFQNYGQTNNPSPYCQPLYSVVPCNQGGPSNSPYAYVNDNINHFVTTGGITNISNMNSGCNGMANNYIYYCNQYLETSAGAVITCSLQSGINFSQGFAIFIDWNLDNTFQNPSEKVGYTNVPSAATWVTTTFTVPSGQANGVYRMRVRSVYATPGSVISPCSLYSYGECEDYNVYLGTTPPAPSNVTVSASNTSPVCPGQSVTLNATSTGTAGYSWSGPLNYTSVLQNPILTSITPSMAGTYYVGVTTGTCPLLAGTYVWIKQAPTLTVSSNVNPSCQGSNVTLSVTSGGSASSYTWSNGSNSVTAQVSPTFNTTYTISASNNTCITSMAYTQSVTICSGLDYLPASAANLSIHPNPFRNEFRVNTSVKTQIKIYNMTGELLFDKVVDDNEVIYTESYIPGIYLLTIRESDYIRTIRIIKN